MLPNNFIGVISIACVSLPVFAVLFFRLYRHTSIIALLSYYVLTVFHGLGSNALPALPDQPDSWDALYHFLEVPLMLSVLLFFCPVQQKQQEMQIFMRIFLVYEAGLALLFGFTTLASRFVMVPGAMMIVFYSLTFFVHQFRFSLRHRKNAGRVLMVGAILLSYSSYLLLVVAPFRFDASPPSGPAVYFVCASMAAVLMSAGLFLMRHRIRELQELKIIRSELQMVFGA